jgi:hypothetical protein
MRLSAALIALVLLASTNALAQTQTTSPMNGCPGGSYSVANSPDGSTLSILFDSFVVTKGQGVDAGNERKTCTIQIPLALPEGYTLGVYRVDYRGFAHLSTGQSSELSVDYALGPHNNSRRYHRGIRGAYDGDFLFTENIGAGLMRRVGCGEAAALNVVATLQLQASRHPGEALLALDSVDGAPAGGLIYHFNRRRCGQ